MVLESNYNFLGGEKIENTVRVKICLILAVALLMVSTAIAANGDNSPDKKHYFVYMDKNVDKGPMRAMVASNGASVKYEYNIIEGLVSVRNLPPQAVEALSKAPGVLKIVEDHEATLHMSEGPYLLNADHVWSQGVTGTGVNVCIIDTGIDYTHPDLNVVKQYDFYNNDNDAIDDMGHGTHCAGIVSSQDSVYRGASYQANLFAAKSINANGGGYESDTVAAIEWCVNQGADVISMSLGFSLHTGVCDSAPAAAASNAAADAGVVVFASSGNDGSNTYIGNPACGSKVIAVGATDKENVRTSYSNGNSQLDIVAPGGEWGEGPGPGYTYSEIVSTFSPNVDNDAGLCFLVSGPLCYDDSYKVGSDMIRCTGTSMSNPMAAAIGAQLLQADPTLTPAQIKQVLRDTATDLGPTGFDVGYGYGIVDAYAAYQAVVGTGCTDNSECFDGNECTDDMCTANGTCVNPWLSDNTLCTGGVCCSGQCTGVVCSDNGDCEDSNSCTGDTCLNGGTCAASCDNAVAPDNTLCPGGICCSGNCSAAACTDGGDCFDGNECTGDTCNNGGTCSATCSNPVVPDDTSCSGGICCTGSCQAPTCWGSSDCNDAEICTTDTCYFGGTCASYCDYAWPGCGIADGCCPSGCDSSNDPDCEADPCGDGYCAGAANGEDCNTCPEDCISGSGTGGTCSACFKGVCDGVCHPVKEGSDCADCATSSYCCGNSMCEPGEDVFSCLVDCGCQSAADCDDGDSCTTDICSNGVCSNDYAACGLSDGCCGPSCSVLTDPDCSAAPDCSTCWKGVCDGSCNPKKEDATCPDCQ